MTDEWRKRFFLYSSSSVEPYITPAERRIARALIQISDSMSPTKILFTSKKQWPSVGEINQPMMVCVCIQCIKMSSLRIWLNDGSSAGRVRCRDESSPEPMMSLHPTTNADAHRRPGASSLLPPTLDFLFIFCFVADWNRNNCRYKRPRFQSGMDKVSP